MSEMHNMKLVNQLDALRLNFDLLEKNISGHDVVAETIHSTFRKIHNIKSNLFFINRPQSLRLTYYMESRFLLSVDCPAHNTL